MSERTLVLVKPDGVRRGLVGEIDRSARAQGPHDPGRCRAAHARPATRRAQHYGEHEGKPFFAELVDFITGGPLVALVVEGHRAVEAVRTLMGVTDPVASTPGSIRGDFALEIGENLVHGSDSHRVRRPRDRAVLPRAGLTHAWPMGGPIAHRWATWCPGPTDGPLVGVSGPGGSTLESVSVPP